ncbi:hypothetical protein JB92DRAFT_3139814 [Gautieria morchelliformis]|nr:hypothetical protein JB92DRAFT_3139814 [Gautieria morchelliformis]
MSIREAALKSEFTVPRESERKLPTQLSAKSSLSLQRQQRDHPLAPREAFASLPPSLTPPNLMGTGTCQLKANKELAGKLLGDDGYIFEDAATSMGMYEHPILQDVINAQWFNPVIALVFTAVEYAIKQWASGLVVSGSQFSEADYHDVYKRHLDGLEQWRNFSTRTAQALARHQQRLYSYGRFRAGFHNVPERVNSRFNNAKLARAAAAIRDASDEE